MKAVAHPAFVVAYPQRWTWFAKDQSVFSALRPSHEQPGSNRFVCRISTHKRAYRTSGFRYPTYRVFEFLGSLSVRPFRLAPQAPLKSFLFFGGAPRPEPNRFVQHLPRGPLAHPFRIRLPELLECPPDLCVSVVAGLRFQLLRTKPIEFGFLFSTMFGAPNAPKTRRRRSRSKGSVASL
jgi:hypothetical protein